MPRVMSLGAASATASTTARYSLPWLLCTVIAQACSSSTRASKPMTAMRPSKSTVSASFSASMARR